MKRRRRNITNTLSLSLSNARARDPRVLVHPSNRRPPHPPARAPQVTLEFDLEDDYTVVTATSVLSPKGGSSSSDAPPPPLVLDGRESFMELLGRGRGVVATQIISINHNRFSTHFSFHSSSTRHKSTFVLSFYDVSASR